jgi:hypothetical protein
MRRLVPLAALVLAAGCGAGSADGPAPPAEGEGEAREGEGEGEAPSEGEGEGEGEQPGEGEGEAGEGEGEPLPNPPEVVIPAGAGPLSLLLVDTDGIAIEGASVVIRDDNGAVIVIRDDRGELLGSTDVDGAFRADVDFGVLYVEVTHPDFTPVRRVLTHADAENGTYLPLRVKPVVVERLPSDVGGVVAVEDATVTFPAGGYVSKATGEPAVGELEVRVAYIDGTNPLELDVAPPLYRLPDGNEGSILVTFGMLNVEMFIAGEPVDLGEGRAAQLDMPLGQYEESFRTMNTIEPGRQTIPTWWWDDEAAIWVEEGAGQIVDAGDDLRWQGSVPHFTWWNLDWAFDGMYRPSSCPSIACGTNTGRCQAGTLRCTYDGHFFWLYDGNCNADNQGNRYSCQPRICDGEIGPTGETCNGQDDDCDGGADEGYGVGNSCTVGLGVCQRGGTIQCNGSGGASCVGTPGTPGTETCNGLDDDCDGTSDEDFNLGASCSVGVGACRRTGTIICDGNGGTTCSATPGSPTAETCSDSRDEDCDGEADSAELFTYTPNDCAGTALPAQARSVRLGDSCTVGCGICQRTGSFICNGGGTARCDVDPGTPRSETCDGRDEDCDGTVDDNPSVTVNVTYEVTIGSGENVTTEERTFQKTGLEGDTCGLESSDNTCSDGVFLCQPGTSGGAPTQACVGDAFDTRDPSTLGSCESPTG